MEENIKTIISVSLTAVFVIFLFIGTIAGIIFSMTKISDEYCEFRGGQILWQEYTRSDGWYRECGPPGQLPIHKQEYELKES